MRRSPELLDWSRAHAVGSRPGDDDQADRAYVWVEFADVDELGELGAPDDAGDPAANGRDRRGTAHGLGRVPHLLWWAIGAAGVAALVLSAVPNPGPAARPHLPPALGGPATQFAAPALPRPVTLPDQVALAAKSPKRLHDTVSRRGTRGDCPAGPKGTPGPKTAAAHAVTAVLPGYHLVDSGETRDRLGQLCLVQLRAKNADGTIIVMSVVPPGPWPGQHGQETVSLQSRREGIWLTRTVSDVTATGWRVDVGAVGEPTVLPTLGQLGALADSRGLQW